MLFRNETREQKPKRNISIDVLKGWLVSTMILAHTIQLFGSFTMTDFLTSNYIGLTAYSTFLLCFGYTTQLSYFNAPEVNKQKILRTVLRILFAYYLSAISYEIFLGERSNDPSLYGSILSLSHIPFYSEFLLGFCLTLILAWLLNSPLKWLQSEPYLFFTTLVLLPFSTFIPYGWVSSTQIGLWIGAPPEVSLTFPVLQYFPFFLIGRYLASEKVTPGKWWVSASIGGVLLFLLYFLLDGLPRRFPPDLAWILGAIPLAILGFVVSEKAAQITIIRRIFTPIGANSLFFLLLSNFLLFALKAEFIEVTFPPILSLLFTIITSGLIWFLHSITRNVKMA